MTRQAAAGPVCPCCVPCAAHDHGRFFGLVSRGRQRQPAGMSLLGLLSMVETLELTGGGGVRRV